MALEFTMDDCIVELRPRKSPNDLIRFNRRQLLQRSDFFRQTLKDDEASSIQKDISESIHVLRLFREFVTTGMILPNLETVPICSPEEDGNPFIQQSFLLIIECYLFGEKYKAPSFCNALLAFWIIKYIRQPRGDHATPIRLAWRDQEHGQKLRDFFVHVFARLNVKPFFSPNEPPAGFHTRVTEERTQLLFEGTASSKNSKVSGEAAEAQKVTFQEDQLGYLKNLDLSPFYLKELPDLLKKSSIIAFDDDDDDDKFDHNEGDEGASSRTTLFFFGNRQQGS